MVETTKVVYAARPYAERLIRPLVTIRRARTLAYPGRVTRRIDDRVAADSVVAEANVPQGYRLIELDKVKGARTRSARGNLARKVMIKRIGDVVERGEVIARFGQLFKKEYASPVSGQIVDMRDTRVLIEAVPQNIELLALYPGQIVDVIQDRGVVIETTGALVQGAWGLGQALRTMLASVVPGGDVPLLAGQITAEHRGMVLLGGRTLDSGAIAQAVENRVRGVIVGSISSHLLPIIAQSGLSFIVTEGFGDVPMHPEAYDLLHSCAGQEVCFQPSTGVEWRTQRPEVFCFIPGQDRPALTEPSPAMGIGTQVRVLRAPYQNAVGEILSLPGYPRRLASGITAWGAEVDLGSAGTVYVPLENLEVIR
jgi:hypothetical protein